MTTPFYDVWRRRFYLTTAVILLVLGKSSSQDLEASAGATVPYLSSQVKCESEYLENGYSVPLTPELTFHYRHNNANALHFVGILEYTGGQAWLGLGFSHNGTMVGSKAIIGIPPTPTAWDMEPFHHPEFYQLKGQDPTTLNGITKAKKMQSVTSLTGKAQYDVDNATTTMRFAIQNPETHLAYSMQGVDVFNFIFAVGNGETLGMHRHRGAFRLDTKNCPPLPDPLLAEAAAAADAATANANTPPVDDAVAAASPPTSTTTQQVNAADSINSSHKAAFAAHGFFATLSFAVMLPIALTAAWFRTLVPKWWIYIHVLSQTSVAFFTTISVACACAGVTLRYKSNSVQLQDDVPHHHMSITHHWMGLTLLIIVLIQVFSGFRRPPVQPKSDPSQLYEHELPVTTRRSIWNLFGLCSCSLSTPREKWHTFHKLLALIIVPFTLYQLQSGFRLYTTQFGGNTKAVIGVFWTWVSLLVVVLGCFKLAVCKRSNNTRSSTVVLPQNLMPTSREEDEDGDDCFGNDSTGRSSSSGHGSHGDAEEADEFTNAII